MIAYQLVSLKGKNNFSYVYGNGIKLYERNTLAFVTRRAINPEESADTREPLVISYAVVIGKRASKKAVVRNRVKRLLRESIKQSLVELQITNKIEMIESMIFIRKKAPNHPMLIRLEHVKPEIISILNCYFTILSKNQGDSQL
jgi:ribonuclease P protein component